MSTRHLTLGLNLKNMRNKKKSSKVGVIFDEEVVVVAGEA